MAFCGNCGTQAENVKFCPSCGQPVGTARQAAPVRQAAPAQQAVPTRQQIPAAPAYAPPVVPGAPGQADIRDAQDNKTMAILAYILFCVPLLTGAHKTSAFARYHTNQGTALFIAAAVYGLAYGILSAILIFIPVIGWALIMLLGFASLFFLVLCIVGILNAANGRTRPLPLVGKLEIIK
jgi:uncharacterized membrane protein